MSSSIWNPQINIVDEELRELLQAFDEVGQGAGYVGYNDALAYAPNTVGYALNQLFLQGDNVDYLSVVTYGAVGDGVTDDTTAILNCRTDAIAQGKAMIFPGGVYAHTGMNLAASDFTIIALGQVELKNTAGGVGLTLDRGTAGHYFKFNMLGDFVVSGNASSTNGVFIRALQHSNIELSVKDVPGTAFVINFGVLTAYKLKSSVNELVGGFNIVPAKGLSIDKRNTGEFVSACRFDLIIEGMAGDGVDVIECQQSYFSVTTETNTGCGLITRVGSKLNNYDLLDIEQNGNGDIQCSGNTDRYTNITCRSTAITNNIEVLPAARGNQFVTSDLRCINLQSGSVDTHLDSCRLSDNGSLGIKGAGQHTRKNCVRYNTSDVITSHYSDIGGRSGTFTPTLIGSTGTAAHVYSSQVGYYQIMDGRLFFEIVVGITTKDTGMTGNASIGGLPFPSATDATRVSIANMGNYNLVTTTTARPQLSGRIIQNSSEMGLFISGPAIGASALPSTGIVDGTSITVSGSYPMQPTFV